MSNLTGKTRYRSSLLSNKLILQVEMRIKVYRPGKYPSPENARYIRKWRDAKSVDLVFVKELNDND